MNQNIKINFTNSKIKTWPTDMKDCILVVDFANFSGDLPSLLESREFSEELKEEVETWSFGEFACSALKFHFSGNFTSFYFWCTMAIFLANSQVSNQILVILKENGFFTIALEQKELVLRAVTAAFKYDTLFSLNESSLKNTLLLLNCSESEISALISNFSVVRTRKVIIEFLLEKEKNM